MKTKSYPKKKAVLLLALLSSASHSSDNHQRLTDIPPLEITSEKTALINLPLNLLSKLREIHETSRRFRSRTLPTGTNYTQASCAIGGHRIIQRLNSYYIDSPYTSAPVESFEELSINCSDNANNDNGSSDHGHTIYGFPNPEDNSDFQNRELTEEIAFIQMGASTESPFTKNNFENNRFFLKSNIMTISNHREENLQSGRMLLLLNSTLRINNKSISNQQALQKQLVIGDESTNDFFSFEFSHHYDPEYEDDLRSERFDGKYGVTVIDGATDTLCFGGHYQIRTDPEIVFFSKSTSQPNNDYYKSEIGRVASGRLIITDINENITKISFDGNSQRILLEINDNDATSLSYQEYTDAREDAIETCQRRLLRP